MILAGLSLCALASISAAAAPVGVVRLALYSALTVGMLAGTNLPVMASINHWFHHRRALAIAVTVFAVSVLDWLLSLATEIPGDTFTIMVSGLLLIGIALPLAFLFLRPTPMPAGIEVSGQAASASASKWYDGQPSVDYGWKEAVRTREFWLLALAGIFLAGANQLARTLGFPLAESRFETEGSYRMFTNIHEIASVSSILFGAAVGMKVGLRTALLAFAALHVVALVVILLANGPGWLLVGIAIAGVGHGGGIALEIAAIGEYFGRRRFATLMGTQGVVTQASQGVAVSVLFGMVPGLAYFSLPGNAAWALAAALVPAAAGVLAYWKLGDPKPAPSQLATATDP